MLTDRESSELMQETDKTKRDARVDAMTEDDAKQMLKLLLEFMHGGYRTDISKI